MVGLNRIMEISKAEFAKGVIGDDYGLEGNLPHIAFLAVPMRGNQA